MSSITTETSTSFPYHVDFLQRNTSGYSQEQPHILETTNGTTPSTFVYGVLGDYSQMLKFTSVSNQIRHHTPDNIAENFQESIAEEKMTIVEVAISLFGNTKPLGGRARAILSEVMYADASDTPDIEGM